MTNYGKKELKPNRYDWNPTMLPEQVVLVTTVDTEDKPHVAAKSRITVISSGPPTIIALASRADYRTASNIKAKGEFVVNIPGDNLVATTWIIGSEPGAFGPDLFSEHGLSPIPSLKVSVPRIAECRAHLECRADYTREIGPDFVVFGEVVSASMDENILSDDDAVAYRRLAPFFFLDSKRTASLGPSRLVNEPVFGPKHDLTIIRTSRLNEAIDFYSTAFGWPEKNKRPGYVEFELSDGSALALCNEEVFSTYTGRRIENSDSKTSNGIILHFFCENLPQILAKLVSLGAEESSELKKRGKGEESACFLDLDGNTLVLSRMAKSRK